MWKRSKFLTLTIILTVSVVLLLGVILLFSMNSSLAGQGKLVFRSNSASKMYDGSDLIDEGYEMLSGKLKQGHSAKVEVSGRQVGVGKSENRIYVTILDMLGADVTGDYDISLEYGVLEVKPIPLYFSTGSSMKQYDEEPLTHFEWQHTTPDALIAGDHVEVTVTGSQVEIGASYNYCTVAVYSQDGRDVTYNYDIQTEYGILTVNKVDLKVQSYSYTTQFGDIAMCEDYAINDWELLPGHRVAEVVISGRQEMPGTSPNTIERVVIVDDKTGEDVSHYYNIIRSEGLLTVEPYNYDIEGVLARFSTSADSRIYLKDQSFGKYMGNGFAYAPTYREHFYLTVSSGGFEGRTDEYSADYLTSVAILSSGMYMPQMLDITWYCAGFGLPYYTMVDGSFDENYDQLRDTIYGSPNKKYSLYYFPMQRLDRIYLLPDNGELKAFEAEYRKYVYEHYTEIEDQATFEYMKKFLSRVGNVSNKNIRSIYDLADFLQSYAAYNVDYDKELDLREDVAVAFLEEYKVGVCRHYAMAATLLYRAAGIPARYTEGFAADVIPDTPIEIFKDMRHAWVEVYIDGMGWIPVEVTGQIGTMQKKAEIIFEDDEQKYGDPAPMVMYTGFEEYEDQGYILVPEYKAIPDVCGKHSIQMVSYRVFDLAGNDVTSQFLLTQQPATRHIYRNVVEFDSYSSDGKLETTYLYDGSLYGLGDIHYNKSLIHADHYVHIVPLASIRNVGVADGLFNVQILDKNGRDVSEEYKIEKHYGRLRVAPRTLILSVNDREKTYDAIPLVPTEYTLEYGLLVSGHSIQSVVFSGSQTTPGTSQSSIASLKIVDGGTDVTANYSITVISGELKVTEK